MMNLTIVPITDFSYQDSILRFCSVPKDFSTHVLKNSSEEYAELDNFFHTNAIRLHREDVLFTNVVFDSDNGEVVAFFSMCAGSRQVFKKFRKHHNTPTIGRNHAMPTVELICFAISNQYQHRGLGAKLIIQVMQSAVNVANTIGASLLVVDAMYDAVPFYQRVGFEDIGESHKMFEQTKLALGMNEVRHALSKIHSNMNS